VQSREEHQRKQGSSNATDVCGRDMRLQVRMFCDTPACRNACARTRPAHKGAKANHKRSQGKPYRPTWHPCTAAADTLVLGNATPGQERCHEWFQARSCVKKDNAQELSPSPGAGGAPGIVSARACSHFRKMKERGRFAPICPLLWAPAAFEPPPHPNPPAPPGRRRAPGVHLAVCV
jgi:hypothetical protein